MREGSNTEEERRVKRRTEIGIIIAIVAVVALTIVCRQKSGPKGAIPVGVALPLSGDAAPYGKEALNAINLAVEQINATGGVNGRPLQLHVEDDKGTVKDGVAALNKLLAECPEMQVFIGGAFSQIASGQIPICERRGIILFSPFASNPELSKPGDCFFRCWPSDTAEGREMALYARKHLGIETVALFTSSSDYGRGLKAVFEKAFIEAGGRITVADEFREGDTDFRTQLTKIKTSDPQAVYMVGWYKEYAQILRQAKDLGLNAQFLSCVTFNKPELLEIAGDAAEGVIFSEPAYSPQDQTPVVADFVAAYKKKFDAEPGTYAAHGYDGVRIVAAAMQSGTSAEAIKNALYDIKGFPGVTGRTTFDENGDVQKPVQFRQVKGGKYQAASDL